MQTNIHQLIQLAYALVEVLNWIDVQLKWMDGEVL